MKTTTPTSNPASQPGGAYGHHPSTLDDDETFVRPYQLGDCLRDTSDGSSAKLILVECPLCASDPTRPRYHFDEGESRPKHIYEQHGCN